MIGRTRQQRRLILLTSILCASPLAARAADVALVGIFPGKAVLVIDGAAPRTLGVGQSVGGVKVDSVERDAVTVDIGGHKSRLEIGVPVSVGGGQGSGNQSVTLISDVRGHFVTSGTVNGAMTTFLVDTGASMVTLGPAMATSAGIDYRHDGQPAMVGTANGNIQAWRVKLDKVTLGDVTLFGVDGMVVQADMPYALLGMSFLNRMDMRRDGSTMTLKRRY